ncbi:MAG: hypothetical protein AAFX00_00780 [Pseudomonadota bacterium]
MSWYARSRADLSALWKGYDKLSGFRNGGERIASPPDAETPDIVTTVYLFGDVTTTINASATLTEHLLASHADRVEDSLRTLNDLPGAIERLAPMSQVAGLSMGVGGTAASLYLSELSLIPLATTLIGPTVGFAVLGAGAAALFRWRLRRALQTL